MSGSPVQQICPCGALFMTGKRGRKTPLCPKCRRDVARRNNADYQAALDRRNRKAVTLLRLVAQAARDGRLLEWAVGIDWTAIEHQMTATGVEVVELFPWP